MKKVFKFLFGAVSLAAIAGGAYYVFKNYICKDKSDELDDFDDFDDDFEDNDTETEESSESRDYINIPVVEEETKEADEPAAEAAE